MTLGSNDTIKFAIPNKGRLSEPTMALIKRAGFSFRQKERMLYATSASADITFVFLRAEDIPLLVANGAIDAGITGQDLVIEKEADVAELLPLDYGKCRLCVAVSQNFPGEEASLLRGKTITTSFPVITKNFFAREKVDVNCIEMSGAIEITIALKIADAIVDIVETGDSLKENNLRIFREIGKYQTVLIANKKIAADERIARIKRRIEGILIADTYSMLEYNIRAEKLRDAEAITPGYESPTISELDEKGWLAVKVMVQKSKLAESMDRLEAIGALALIETEIKNCRLGKK
ncbi:MAG: ATP phosphoribosyltransferase [Spirochaetota bacterium]